MRVRYKWSRLYCICVHSIVVIMSGIFCMFEGRSGDGRVGQERNAS